jgi:hypothetical protein
VVTAILTDKQHKEAASNPSLAWLEGASYAVVRDSAPPEYYSMKKIRICSKGKCTYLKRVPIPRTIVWTKVEAKYKGEYYYGWIGAVDRLGIIPYDPAARAHLPAALR